MIIKFILGKNNPIYSMCVPFLDAVIICILESTRINRILIVIASIIIMSDHNVRRANNSFIILN